MLLLSPRAKPPWPALPPPAPPQHVPVPRLVPGPGAHRGAVGGPGDEEPLVALGVLAVQAVQDVAGLLLIQQGQHKGVIVSVPAPG